jgi:hypothetical protein
MDNSMCQNTSKIASKFAKRHLSRLSHPPYSTDINCCDFCLFSLLKGIFKDHEFSSSEQIQEAITKVRTISVLRTCAASSRSGSPALSASLRLEESIFINQTEWNSKSCEIMEIGRGRGLFLSPVADRSY